MESNFCDKQDIKREKIIFIFMSVKLIFKRQKRKEKRKHKERKKEKAIQPVDEYGEKINLQHDATYFCN